MKRCTYLFFVSWLMAALTFPVGSLRAQASADQLKDFRATNQRIALLGLQTEFIEAGADEKITEQIRRELNRYSKTYGSSSIAGFTLGQNPGKQNFKPASAASLDEGQKKFLQAAAKDNQIEIIALGALRDASEAFELELQLYDNRTETLSGVEKAQIPKVQAQQALEGLVFRLLNHLDRDGFVHTSPQDFLKPPLSLGGPVASVGDVAEKDFSLNPHDLSSGTLAGGVSIGGNKTPFWETWWFWTILLGSMATAGGLTYYFVVVDQPPTTANTSFRLP